MNCLQTILVNPLCNVLSKLMCTKVPRSNTIRRTKRERSVSYQDGVQHNNQIGAVSHRMKKMNGLC